MRTRPFHLIASAALAASLLAACGDDGGDVQAFCDKFEAMDDLEPDFTSENGLDDAVSALEEIEDVAPSEIKDDVGTVVDAFKQIAAIDFTDVEALAEMEETMTELSENMEAAGNRLEAFTDENCAS